MFKVSKGIKIIFYALILLSLQVNLIFSQDVKMINGGFEDRPKLGNKDEYFDVDGWFDCGRIEFKWESPPDIHQGVGRDTVFWGNQQASAQGKTYLGMVVRESESYESLSQRLATPLKAGKCYSFSVQLSMSPHYLSGVGQSTKVRNFTEPTVLRLWGGDGLCADTELLLESDPVDHSEWRTYSFKISPSRDYRHIRIEAFWKTPLLFPYNGHILVDDMSDFELMECEEDIELYVANKVEKAPKQTRILPAHKAGKKRQVAFERGSNETTIDTVVYKRPSKDKILTLDRATMKRGQNIRIDQLYFSADTSMIDVESFSVLDEVFDFLNTNLDIKVEIQGHTNNIPDHDYCDRLSTDRAKAVANYLVAKGIQEKRIKYKGWGKRKPVATNGTSEGRKKNQRVEIKIVSIG